MSFFQWDDIDQGAGNIKFRKLTSLDRENLTGTVEDFGTCPIHYHCKPEDVDDDGSSWVGTYPDSMDEKGAGAFKVGDVVAIMFRGGDDSDPVIIGVKGEARFCDCSFYFKVFGEDCGGSGSGSGSGGGSGGGSGSGGSGGELTENVYFSLVNEDKKPVALEDPPEYDPESGFWFFVPKVEEGEEEEFTPGGSGGSGGSGGGSVGPVDPGEEESGGDCIGPYWVYVFSPGYMLSQHQGKTKTSEMLLEEDLIEADGSEREETLVCFEGETGYWEDWENNLICGKHTWEIDVSISSPHQFSEGECLSLPINYEAINGKVSLSLTRQVLVMYLDTFYTDDESGGSSAFISLEFKPRSDDLMPNLNGKFRVKFSQLSLKNSLGSQSFYSDFYFFLGKPGSSENYVEIWVHLVVGGAEGKAAISEIFIDEKRLDIWAEDYMDVEEGGILEIDLRKAGITNWLRDIDSGMEFYFWSTVSTGTKSFGVHSIGIDWIDFDKWEDWKDDLICEKHEWTLTLPSRISGASGKCKEYPEGVLDPLGTAIYFSEVKDEFLSMSIVNSDQHGFMVYFWMSSEQDPPISPKNLILKCTAHTTGTKQDGCFIMLWQEGGSEYTVLILAGDKSAWEGSNYHEVGDNDGEEMQIDLSASPYNISGRITEVWFFLQAGIEQPSVVSSHLTVDYIDFRYGLDE